MSRTYVITGAGSGIGKTTAGILREAGNTVIGVDLRGAEIEADLSTHEGRLTAAAKATEEAGGTVDAVIACAGIAAPKALTAAINYFGMTEFLTSMQPALARSESPRAALISSVSSIQPVFPPLVEALVADDETAALEVASRVEADPQAAGTIYASSKQAISRWVRREAPTATWAGAGIPLNAVGPGTVLTPMTEALRGDPSTMKMVDAVVPMPLNGHQGPETVANLLIWLTSVENSHCCGQTIYCDGGAEVVLRGDDVYSWNEPAIDQKFADIFASLAE